jgi:hypothetical protein
LFRGKAFQFEQNIHLKLGVFIVDESEIEFVKSQGLTINLPSIGAPVAVRAEGDEVVILVSLTLRPRDNVMNVDLNVSAGGDGAAVSSLNKNSPADFRGYWRSPIVHVSTSRTHPKAESGEK